MKSGLPLRKGNPTLMMSSTSIWDVSSEEESGIKHEWCHLPRYGTYPLRNGNPTRMMSSTLIWDASSKKGESSTNDGIYLNMGHILCGRGIQHEWCHLPQYGIYPTRKWNPTLMMSSTYILDLFSEEVESNMNDVIYLNMEHILLGRGIQH